MKTEVELVKDFATKGVSYGQELIVLKEFCGEFVESSRQARLVIVGIEGFHLLSNGAVKPNLDEIADFSDLDTEDWDQYVEKTARASRDFIGRMLDVGRSDGYCFSLEGLPSTVEKGPGCSQ